LRSVHALSTWPHTHRAPCIACMRPWTASRLCLSILLALSAAAHGPIRSCQTSPAGSISQRAANSMMIAMGTARSALQKRSATRPSTGAWLACAMIAIQRVGRNGGSASATPSRITPQFFSRETGLSKRRGTSATTASRHYIPAVGLAGQRSIQRFGFDAMLFS